MNNAIEINELHVGYRSKNGAWVEAVRGLTCHVREGEVVGFLGPNGAGKSSTLKALMGFVEPTGGECSVFGLVAGSLEAKSRVGYLPEVALYYPFLTPLETLRLYGELQGLRGMLLKKEAEMLLESVGLKDAMHKQNRQLSKGMLQRVGIAQSLLGNPSLLVLDEVTSGLDPVGRRELRDLLKKRQQQGCTLFFSSHELAEVEMLCDRILLIHQGVLIEEREIGELRDHLRQYEITYVGTANLIGLADHWEERRDCMRYARFDDKPKLMEAIERITTSGGRVVDVVAQEGSLETYFVERIQEAA
jgi:ABC-2 type transport system ATP-binding protein